MIPIEEKREFIAYYEKYGPRATEEKYGLELCSSYNRYDSYVKSIQESTYMTITEFVNKSSYFEIDEFIAYSNKFGRIAASKKYHVKRYFYLNRASVRMLVERGLVIRKSNSRKISLYMEIDRMKAAGCTFDEIIKKFSSSYSKNQIRICIKRWCHDNKFPEDQQIIRDYDTHPIDIKELREYVESHTVAETAEHFDCSYARMHRMLMRYEIRSTNIDDNALRDKLKITDPDIAKNYIRDHTMGQSAKYFNVSYNVIYKLCRYHGLAYKMAYKKREACKTKE